MTLFVARVAWRGRCAVKFADSAGHPRGLGDGRRGGGNPVTRRKRGAPQPQARAVWTNEKALALAAGASFGQLFFFFFVKIQED